MESKQELKEKGGEKQSREWGRGTEGEGERREGWRRLKGKRRASGGRKRGG